MHLLTLGHSNHDWPAFRQLLDLHHVGAIADVRSRPRSRRRHFSAPHFRAKLNQIGVAYVFLGDQLGGMPTHGTDRYESMAQTIEFRTGIARLMEIMPRTRLAICCSEHDPLDCHRFLLISRHLAELGIEIEHIHRNGSIETQQEAGQRLIARTHVLPDMLASHDDMLAEAFRRRERRLRGEPA